MTDKEFLAIFLGRYQRALAKIATLEQCTLPCRQFALLTFDSEITGIAAF